MGMRRGLTLSLAAAMAGTAVWAHQGMKHAAAPEASPAAGSRALARINEAYLRQVRPIFFEKCFDCHGSGRPLPWYSRLPGPRQLIQYDIRTARKHLDMGRDFPFGGHASQLEHLKALEEVLKDGSMPPWRYRVMHRGSKLLPQEIAAVLAWIDEGKKLLETKEGGHDR
ncbi:MAG: heme-binding domain-containing protein [Elusimicrobia bacterium]|nr:heme-binding domain-containing protein [Elusimicrobiota bacterium]